ERTEPLIHTLRKAHPEIPIVLVEDRTYGNAFLSEERHQHNIDSRAALHKAYDALVAAGDKHLAYVNGETMLAADGEDSVDGSHRAGLGFGHQADGMQPVLEKVLGK